MEHSARGREHGAERIVHGVRPFAGMTPKDVLKAGCPPAQV